VDNKETNAQAIIALAGMGKLFWPRAAWVAELQRQVLVFPAGSPDDGVDTLGLLGRGAAKLGGKRRAGAVAAQREKLRVLKGGRDLSIAVNSTSWMGN
jgi:phage terminase large subunit-like protein